MLPALTFIFEDFLSWPKHRLSLSPPSSPGRHPSFSLAPCSALPSRPHDARTTPARPPTELDQPDASIRKPPSFQRASKQASKHCTARHHRIAAPLLQLHGIPLEEEDGLRIHRQSHLCQRRAEKKDTCPRGTLWRHQPAFLRRFGLYAAPTLPSLTLLGSHGAVLFQVLESVRTPESRRSRLAVRPLGRL